MSLRNAVNAGRAAALTRFGIKTAAPLAQEFGNAIRGAPNALKNMFIGAPGRAFVEGPGAFRPGGMLSHENVWWPRTQGLRGTQKIMPWLQRAGTLAVPLQLMSSAHSNPNDSTLSNVLGTAGSIAGSMYGMPTGGLIGGMALSRLGARAGQGIGHLLGGSPQAPQYSPSPQEPQP